jgi:RNA polymerase sigma factor (sigma-70 family)
MVLLERLRNGEHDAREELLRRYWPRLERWARGRLPQSARDLYDTVDVVQDTFLAALGRLEGFEPENSASLQAYLRTAVLNRIRSLARRSRQRGEKLPLAYEPQDLGPSPLEELIGRDALDRYERALARLRGEDRQVIHLKIELDLPYEELALELGKPSITAARMAVSRALYRLTREMQHHA